MSEKFIKKPGFLKKVLRSFFDRKMSPFLAPFVGVEEKHSKDFLAELIPDHDLFSDLGLRWKYFFGFSKRRCRKNKYLSQILGDTVVFLRKMALFFRSQKKQSVGSILH